MKRVYLEITNSCNLNCPFCTNSKGNDFLSLSQIEDYLSQIKPYCNYIYLHILGEPLLHPQFDKILKLLDEKQMDLQLVTNGTLLSRYPDLLKHTSLRKLSISLHSINNIDVDADYFDTINNLIDNNNNKIIDLRFYDLNNLDQKLENYLNKLKTKYGFALNSRNNSYKLKDNVYISFEEFFHWPDINDPVISDKGTCHGAIDMIAINSKSEVTICCLDPYAHNSIGNLKRMSLKQILESDKYKKTVEDISNHNLTNELCKRCSYRLRFK